MNKIISYQNVVDPKPNKIDEVKKEPVLNEQEEKLKEEVNSEKVAQECLGEDKDGLKKDTLNETNVDTDIVNGQEQESIINE